MTTPKATVSISQLMSLRGKTAIVTGGARGLGLAIVYRLAEAGARTVIADVETGKGGEAAARLRGQGFEAAFVHCDVTGEAGVRELVETAVRLFGGVDILVNNAGVFPFSMVADMSADAFMRVLDVNTKGSFLCAREVARRMAAQGTGGCIINVASIDALRPSQKGLCAYDASKGALWTLTRSLAGELATYGIRVNAIAPGGVLTEGTRASMTVQEGGAPVDMKAWLRSFMSRTALKRMGAPDEIARVALFLASDLSSYMTGSLVVADGGLLVS